MQNSTLPKFEISVFEKLGFGKIRNWQLTTSKNTNSAPQNLKLDCDMEFSIQKSIFENLKSISPIPSNLVSRPKNLISAMSQTPKSTFSFQKYHFRLKFFFDQNLDFVLGCGWNVSYD